MLAGLLYAGSGVGLAFGLAVRGSLWRAAERPRFAPGDYKWLAGAVVSGGVIGPALLMLALAASSASSVSLLLNLEGVFTALLAWFVFRENFDRRLALGMACITAGGMRSEEHTSELQSQSNLVCRLLLEKKKKRTQLITMSKHQDLDHD